LCKLVTIGLCTKNVQETVNKTLETLLELEYPQKAIEVVVVDGLSTDETVNLIRSVLNRSNLKWTLLFDRGFGLAYARQMVVDTACSELIAFIDADQYLSPTSLKKLVKDLSSHSNVAAVRGVQGITSALSLPGTLENYIKFIHDMECPREADASSFAIGGSLFRKEAIVSVGGFDRSFTVVAEDTDLSARLIKAGWKILNCKTSMFYHISRQSWKNLYKQYRGWGRGFALATRKHGCLFQKYGFLSLLMSFLESFFFGIRYTLKTWVQTQDLWCILMPFHYVYKKAAWTLGYLEGKRSVNTMTI
jgi:cellulose synthase/poly-beta-1,6-N-acetylglucosamine synthase-like glycosyltransferase